MKCLQCNNKATATTLIVGFENGKAKTTTISNRCWSCTNSINDYMKREYNDKMRNAREDSEKERERKKKEQEEKDRKWREYQQREKNKKSCRVCSKESSLYHYIFNKKTNKFEESWSNATDPENEIVFCTKEHFQTWLKQILKDREKLRQEKINLANKEKEELEEELRKLEEENNKEFKCSQCSNTWKVGESYFYNSEKNDGKKFCSSSCFQESYAESCDKCNKKVGLNEKSYYADAKSKTGNLCESCWKTKKQGEQNQQPNQTPTTPSPEPEEEKNNKPASTNSPTPPSPSPSNSPNQPSPSPNSPNQSPNHSPSPNKSPQESPSNTPLPKINFSDSNPTRDKNFYKCLEEIKNSGEKAVVFPFDISNKQKIFLTAIQDAKLKKYIDYDKLELSESEKGELREPISKLGVSANDNRDYLEDKSEHGGSLEWLKIIGGVGILVIAPISFLIIVVRARNIKRKLKKQLRKKIKKQSK